MRARRIVVSLLAAVVALACASPAAFARDADVTSFDGTKIVTHFFPAEGLAPGRKAPSVLVGHGYGMTGDTDPDSSSESLFGSVGLGPLRRAGYNVLTWDARGFGQSGGQVMVDSPDFEGRDVQALISHVAKQPEAELDGPDDPRLGMNGVSYGGGIQLVTAAIDRRVDVITPTISWNSLVSSLYKDARVKQGWGSVLAGAGGTAFTNGIAKPPPAETGGTDPAITRALVEGTSTGQFSPDSVEFFRSRGPGALVDRIRVPTLLLQGTVDTLFTLEESMANHARLRANGVPVRMVWFCGGHGVCLTEKGPEDLVEKSVIAWLNRWLKEDPRVDTGAPFSFVAQDGKLRDGATFPPVERGALEASGSATLPITPGNGNGGLIFASPSPEAARLAVPAPQGEADLLGEPRLDLTYSGTGAPSDTHVFAQIVDTQRNLVVGNVATPIPVTLDGKPHTLSRSLEPIAYHAAPGAKLELQLAPATSLYSSQRTTGVLAFERIALRIPSADTGVRRAERLRIGRPRGVRRARRGRAFRVRVRAEGATLRGVRVVVMNRKGRRVGRSREFGLRTRTKSVRVKVRRRLRRGRYRVRASGLTAEGNRVTVSRRVRVKRARRR